MYQQRAVAWFQSPGEHPGGFAVVPIKLLPAKNYEEVNFLLKMSWLIGTEKLVFAFLKFQGWERLGRG